MVISQEQSIIQRINALLYSPAYLILIGGLTIVSNVFAQELIVYTVFILIAAYICLQARDMLPLLPLFICGYISPSRGNNPGLNDESVFSLSGAGLYWIILLSAVAICLFCRLIKDPDFGGLKFLRKKRKLLTGMLTLGAAYAVSGLGSGQLTTLGWRNLFFAFLQFAAIAGLYFLFTGGVRWDIAPKAYLFWTGTCVGYVLFFELLNLYFTANVIIDGAIFRNDIYTGWGHYNNIGAMFAMIIPLPFFLTGKGRYASFAYISAIFFYIGLVFTSSRGAILIGTPIFVIGYILSLCHRRHARRQLVIHIGALAAVVLGVLFMEDKFLRLFRVFGEIGLESTARLRIYGIGLEQFKRFPIFGGSFFPVDITIYSWSSSESFISMFPPRWHNTVVQLLATGGITCLIAYGHHRLQTIKLFIRDFSDEKLFAALSILALLLTSMLDCHFFNIGPVLLYSATLAVVECQLGNNETRTV